MWDMVTPIMIGDNHIGNLFLGQFFFDEENPDTNLFQRQAEKYGFDWNEYRSALEKVPRWSRDKVNTVMDFYSQFAEMISKLSYSNIKLARSLEEKKIKNDGIPG